MNAPFTFLFPILAAVMVIVSCGEKTPKKRETKDESADFYLGNEPTLKVESLKNEMADSESDFLRSFSKDLIPWQKWDEKILEKATKAQLPVFVFVGSSLGSASRQVAREINDEEKLRNLVSGEAICTVVDTHLHPTLGILSYHLSTEINRITAFPMVIWLSPEGSPLAWIPVGPSSGRDLDKVITSASAMVSDIWQNSSRYAVENSRRDNEQRQLRFNHLAPNDQLPANSTRDALFQRFTRQLSSLYSPGEKDLDNIGGLLPTSSLKLLAVGSRSKLLTEEVRERCRVAAREVSGQLMTGALRDPLDRSYFYARKTNDWSLPSFSKDLESQARVASLFITLGSILNEPKFTKEGLGLLKTIETNWLDKNLTILSSMSDKESPDTFLWSFDALKKVLTKEELKLATIAFSLKKDGNIPVVVDPTGRYYNLNSLKNKTSLPELATIAAEPEEAIAPKLEAIRKKMLQHRIQEGHLVSESNITLADLVSILQAQIKRSVQTGTTTDLDLCLKTARRITRDYWDPQNGLSRHLGKVTNVPACGRDYAALSLTLTLLYHHTLDQEWLSLATAIMDQALADLTTENELIAENAASKRIIPLRQHNITMIFGTSTLGFADQAAGRLLALTGNPVYRDLRKRHFGIIAARSLDAVVNHTDFTLSCALGDVPLVAAIQGPVTSPAAREFLAILNSPSNLPFLSIRPAETMPPLRNLPDLPAPKGENSVVLLKGDQILGQAASGSELTALLNSAISEEE